MQRWFTPKFNVPRTEMMDLSVDGEAKGITVRDLVTGEIRTYAADAVVLATGGYSNVFFLYKRHGL